jgi:YfiH family protein
MENLSETVVLAKNLISPGVSHGFFSRKCGKSTGHYASLNCAKYVGDDRENVSKNLDIARKFLNASALVTLRQVHSSICVKVSAAAVDDESPINADAMVTNAKGIAIGVLTADCVPLLFYDAKKAVIGAAHAGWRGAVSGIIESTLKKMAEFGCNPADINVALGPCIGKNSYEVDDDFKKNFKGRGDCFCTIDAKMHFDLPKYCSRMLLESGVQKSNIEIIDIDTFADNENYFSYRFANKFSGGVCGRNISAICIAA